MEENQGDMNLKNPLAGDAGMEKGPGDEGIEKGPGDEGIEKGSNDDGIEEGSDDEGIETGHAGQMENTGHPTEEVNLNAANEKDGWDLQEEIKSESFSVQEIITVNDEGNDQGDQPSGSMIAESLVGGMNEEVNEKAQSEEVQSRGNKLVYEMKNEETSTDEHGNHSESPTAVEAKTTDIQEENHADQLSKNSDQQNQPEDKTDIEEIQKVEMVGHEANGQGTELTENISHITNNLDGALETKRNSEAGNSENEGEHLEGEIDSLLEKWDESLVSENEVKNDQPETKRGEVVANENLSENSKLDLKAQVENDTDSAGEGQNKQKEKESVFDGTEVPGMEANRSTSSSSLNVNPDSPATVSETAVAIKNFMKQKSSVFVSTFIRRLSGKKDNDGNGGSNDGKGQIEDPKADAGEKNREEPLDSVVEPETKDISQKTAERSPWNPLTFLIMSRDLDSKPHAVEGVEAEPISPITMKGRIILYTRLGCQECKEARLYLHQKRLGYVEVNIDMYPSRKSELEKLSGASLVPKIFFNEVLIGGFSELKSLGESGKLEEKINYLISEAPSLDAPLPPFSGEDDESNNGTVDENALFVRKMRESIMVRDRFHRMRRYTSCFLGSDAVNFISEDRYLEREEATQFGRKLASQFFILHVFEENLFEDGNHLYRFLDQDPIVLSQCQNIPRGILDLKPKPITEIASRLRFLQYAMLEAYASGDGRHLDYRSIHGSEEFARYLRTVEELQRIDLQDMPREEKLAFFINLYNMMAIHVILIWGHPTGALDRRRVFGDFKYVVGGCTYSLSAIQNGILRANQRPPYNLVKPFGAKDRRAKLVLPDVEPLIHFALVCGTRSGPALQCYSPGNFDKELTEAARNFLKMGGLVVDLNSKVASVSKILKWYSGDFGKNETEVLKHVAKYLDPPESEAMLELIHNNQLKVTYQPYEWGLNH
ncbi:hypothetical protein QQ045_033415 [Rhodiola kirilowii]